ncbi:MAG: hypothetical protein ACAI38_02490 [Myxococcota bacterium]
MRCLIAVACAVATACSFQAGDTCEDDACLANEAPIARIRGVDGEGNLRVGARTTVLISAADSVDADLDPLTYAWSVGADCAGSVVGATDAVELRLSNLTAGGECGVTLTVSDGTGEGSASARLVIRDVGAYVSTAPPCAATYDAASDAAQGTPELPFCNLRAALLAAADYQLAEASLATVGVQQLDGDLLIDRSITVRGGYTRGSISWGTPAPAARSEIALAAPLGQGSDPRVAVAAPSPSDTVTLANLAVYRVVPCLGECVLVDATATNLTLTNVDLGVSPSTGSAVNTGAAGAVYYSVRANGGDGNVRPLLTTNAVSIRGALTGFASVGVTLLNGMNAVLSGTTINEGAHAVTGVRLLRAGDVRIQGSTIIARSDAETADLARAPDSLAFGITDGNASTLDLGGCIPEAGTTCGSSGSLTLVGTTINVSKARLAVGVAALGTGHVAFLAPSVSQRSTLTVSARQAYGLLTMDLGNSVNDVAGMSCDGLNIDVTVSANAGAPASFAAGWSDGYETPQPDVTNALVGLGSYRASLANAVIAVRVGTHFVGEAAGVVLRDSRRAEVTNVMVTVVPAPGVRPVNGWTVARIAGVRLMRTTGVAITGGSVSMADLAAAWIAGALIDGQMNLANDDIATAPGGGSYGSTLLSVSNASYSGVLSVNNVGEVPLRACIGLFGTDTAQISSTTVACQLGTSENEPVPTMAGVVTLLTRDVTLADSVVRVEDATPSSAVRLIGVQDGSRRASTFGSLGLRVARNIVTVDAPSTLAVGVRLSGKYTATAQAADKVTVIDDNVINLKQSAANVGVLAFTTAATIAFNNVRVASCTASSCDQAFATGFYLMHVAHADPLLLLANGFGVFDQSFGGGDVRAAPLVVEHANTGAELGVTALVDNVYGVENPSSLSALMVRFEDPSNDDVLPPQSYDSLDESGINALFPGTAEGNYPEPPLFCSDAIHGDPLGPQAGRVTHITAAELGIADIRDIDGATRILDGADAGADVLGVCP